MNRLYRSLLGRIIRLSFFYLRGDMLWIFILLVC
nr:MAG TPA: hypothetical protein [Caudoviricetes sp.]